jgi:Cu-Zn family superoxide dismutase
MDEPVRAIAVFQNRLRGSVTFVETKRGVKVTVSVRRIPEGRHGFHIHERGNLLVTDCMGCKGHWNPTNKQHGGRKDKERHVGDLGNVEAVDGSVEVVFYDKVIKLRGKHSILGRSVVIHEGEDDLGRGEPPESLVTGNAGKRLDCAVIGYF